MTLAVERLAWRFGAWEQVCQACRQTRITLDRFLTLRPERLRLRFGESARHSQVPIVFAPDLAETLAARLPPRTTTPSTGALALERDALRRTLSLAQLDGDLDVGDVVGWRGADAFLATAAGFYQRLFDEARASGEGEETAAFFQVVLSSVLRNVLLHHVGTDERFLGLAAFLAHLCDRALGTMAERTSDGLTARLGLLLMAGCSPLALMGAAEPTSSRPGNVYRTIPAAWRRASSMVRADLDAAGALDLVAMRARLAAELLADAVHRRDVVRSMLAEAVRDCALLSTLMQGSELRDLAGRSAALSEALFSPLGPEKLSQRLARHPQAGEGALAKLALFTGSIGAIVAGDVEHLKKLGSIEARADVAAMGALVLALDEVALERGSEALAMARPVPPSRAAQARRDGRAYWFGLDEEPLYLMPQQRKEAFFFADVKDFTRRTAAVREDAMSDFLKRRFYDPILRTCADLGRKPEAAVDVVNLLGDAVAARGDVSSMVALAVYVRRLLAETADELAGAARSLAARDEVLAEIEVELAAVERKLAELPEAAIDQRADLELHRIGLAGGKEQRLAHILGGGLEAGVFVSWGPQATVIEAGGPGIGEWRVFIAEYLNAAARGTNRSAHLVKQRAELRRLDEEEHKRRLLDPFQVHTSSDPFERNATTEFHNAGAALTGEALAAYREAAPDLVFREVSLAREALPARLSKYWLPRPVEDYVVARDAGGAAALLFRMAGRTIFRGLEASGGADIWEIVLVDHGFGRDLVAALDDAA